MARIELKDSLSVGVKLIDEQHKMLIQRLSDLSEAIEMSRGEVEIVKTLGFMVDYTDLHFSAEEDIMAEQNYPGLEHQKKQHAEFKSNLKQLVEDFEEEGATKVLAISLDAYLINWLIKHIEGVDLELGVFLNEKNS